MGLPRVNRQPYALILSQDEVAYLLLRAVPRINEDNCGGDDCETCQGFLACWWDLYNNLERPMKLVLADVIQKTGQPLPAAPWELEG